jgi:hypothetical protein
MAAELQIAITRCPEDNSFSVCTDGRSAIGLGWDEMLGLLASLTIPAPGCCQQWLQTDEQREEWKRHREEVKKRREAESPQPQT